MATYFPDYFNQNGYQIKFDWGLPGLNNLLLTSDVIILIDVLSFTTCVDIAVARGAQIYPFAGTMQEAERFASSRGAALASHGRPDRGLSLSPRSLLALESGARLVLPSPNGSTLSVAQDQIPLLAGCLRNSESVARAAQRIGDRIAVIAAGERWPGDRTLRPSFEDLIGAGALIQAMDGPKSPEAQSAQAAFSSAQDNLGEWLLECGSGRELFERGFEQDVKLAAMYNISSAVPRLTNGAFRNFSDNRDDRKASG